MSLRTRIASLEHDLREREQVLLSSEELIKRWHTELAEAKAALARELSHPIIRHGIDLAFGHPNPHAVKQLGVSFVCRYYSFNAGKNLTRAEAEDWSHVGVDIVTVWEAAGQGALLGYDGGVSAAHAAESLAKDVGQPSHTPIYFAVDFEPQPDEWDAIDGYFRGCADVLGRSRVGVYGGLATVSESHLKNFAEWRWQTLAWSGVPTRWYNRTNIRQVSINNLVAGTPADMDISVTHNFGQWRI